MGYINPKYITPLPRLTPPPPSYDKSTLVGDRYEAVVIGAGPTGLLLSVFLTRYNLTSVLTVDAKLGPVTAGHADGFNARTMEILASLGLHHELLDLDSCMTSVCFWGPDKEGGKGIVRTGVAPSKDRTSKFPFTTTVSQAHVERVFTNDLENRGNPVRYGWRFVEFKLREEEEYKEFPVEIKIQSTSDEADIKTVYAKHLIGADGAHSNVRAGMGIPMEGSGTDDIWGVVDTVAKSNFPDKRRACPIVSQNGSLLWIPRERISPTEQLTRIYVQLATTASDGSAAADQTVASASTAAFKHHTRYAAETFAEENAAIPTNNNPDSNSRSTTKTLRLKATLDDILSRIPPALYPYSFEPGHIDWWASYQVGQRMAPSYTFPTSTHSPPSPARVLIAGDACHTHSPKAGQGMNFGLADAQNLAWKLVYAIHGLVTDPNALVKSYEDERHQAARTLLEFDKKWSRLFSGGLSPAEAGLRPEEFMRLMAVNQSFISGHGIQYPASYLVGQKKDEVREHMDEILRPGRVLCSASLIRFDDGSAVDSQDAMYANGKFRVVALIPESTGSSPQDEAWWPALEALLNNLQTDVLRSVVETIIIHPWPALNHDIEWTHFPAIVREVSERNVYGEAKEDGVYGVWGIERGVGALAVVRPDGYVGAHFGWGEMDALRLYFRGVIG
ncbi:uncharacterized protein N0V89_012569 [Didymosphaeria variabile]|uniref:FAD/NAD(P)-binding domain-containing protein n=1 Tax=Didymosphaeria variabile TaxID=1932322 RepID=A0A9W8XA65_9PLEO|nr:uncharacterized protein N0V89_012569 [Didymosphaeria variabile]KAJ4344825.1 hypothetical protein N0V89_012569 [Didymosphaeria variabile]